VAWSWKAGRHVNVQKQQAESVQVQGWQLPTYKNADFLFPLIL